MESILAKIFVQFFLYIISIFSLINFFHVKDKSLSINLYLYIISTFSLINFHVQVHLQKYLFDSFLLIYICTISIISLINFHMQDKSQIH